MRTPRSVKSGFEALNSEQEVMMRELMDMYDPCTSIESQSLEYVELAKKFNETLSHEQRIYARAI